MSTFYDRALAWPASPPPAPEPRPLVGGTPPATPETQARRDQRLGLAQHRAPAPTRQQLASREKALLRELRAIEQELGTVRQQLAA